jgi:ubiquitin thioesterase OTU1
MSFVAVRYNGKTHRLKATADTTIASLMTEIRDLTNVFPSRQSLTWGIRPVQPIPTDGASLGLTLAAVGLKKGELLTLTEQTRGATAESGMRHITSTLEEAIKIEISGDNSCLFNAVSYCCTGNAHRASELREHCIREIRAHPDIYTDAMLGQSVDAYCRWITDPNHWGGYIEMGILSKRFEVEIGVLHIEEANLVPVNNCNATKRIYVLYDGMHYDALVFRGFSTPEQRIVNCDDGKALELAMEVVQLLQQSGAYRNNNTMEMKCDRCGAVVKGKRGAEAHGRQTGHTSYSQARRK